MRRVLRVLEFLATLVAAVVLSTAWSVLSSSREYWAIHEGVRGMLAGTRLYAASAVILLASLALYAAVLWVLRLRSRST